MFVLLLAPFAVFVVLGLWRGITLHPPVQWSQPASATAFSTAVLVAMWNYMGWDNASTVAQEVENPQRNYPRAMIASTFLVAVTYILPLAAMALAGLSADSFSTGDWTDAARTIGGTGLLGAGLGLAVVAGGAISGIGMFNALVMSYTRLPMTMAEDGMLPRVLARRSGRGVPWVSVLLCGLAWALALKLPFERLISIDLILYGSSLLLEFVALAVLRIREPDLERPFKAGNFTIACLLGVAPAALIGYALYAARDEKLIGTFSALVFAVVVGLLGPLLYWLTAAPLLRRRRFAVAAAEVGLPVGEKPLNQK
jgi:amino acid transporter